MPIARTATNIPIPVQSKEDQSRIHSVPGGIVPEGALFQMGLENGYAHLDEKEMSWASEVYGWALDQFDGKDRTPENAIKKIERLNLKIGGAIGYGESRLGKLWNYVHVANKVREIEEKRNNITQMKRVKFRKIFRRDK